MNSMTASNQLENDRYTTRHESTHESDASLQAKDTFAAIVAAIMTIGPLAATALFAH